MTYEYRDLVTGETFEVEQRISEPAFTHRHYTSGAWHYAPAYSSSSKALESIAENHPVKRLISAQNGGFRLVSGDSGGWASQGYSKPENQRKAEATLGRKLVKRTY